MASNFTPSAGPHRDDPPGSRGSSNALGPTVEAIVILFVVMSTTATIARLIAKKSMGKFEIDDYLSIAAWILFIGYATTIDIQAHAGMGRHRWNVSNSAAIKITQLSWAAELIYAVDLWLAKATILFQLQSIFSPSRTGYFYIGCQSLIWGNLVFYGLCVIVFAVECIPTKKIWDPNVSSGHCVNTVGVIVAMGAINVLSDLMIILLPSWAILHLHTSTRTKRNALVVFTAGGCVVICSICRLVYSVRLLENTDTTYAIAPVALSAMAEIVALILCTCLPLMPRLVHVVRARLRRDDANKDRNILVNERFDGKGLVPKLRDGDMAQENSEQESKDGFEIR